MQHNIISQKLRILGEGYDGNKIHSNTEVVVQSHCLLSIQEFSAILMQYGYSLQSDLYMEILFLISHTTKVEHLMEFFKELQEHISPHTTCMVNFEIIKHKHCITEVILK